MKILPPGGPKLKIKQERVATFEIKRVTPVADSIAWVCCSSGNVWVKVPKCDWNSYGWQMNCSAQPNLLLMMATPLWTSIFSKRSGVRHLGSIPKKSHNIGRGSSPKDGLFDQKRVNRLIGKCTVYIVHIYTSKRSFRDPYCSRNGFGPSLWGPMLVP